MTTERELSQEAAEDLFEDAPCGYLSTSPDGTIERVNRTFESMTGLDREGLIGRRRFKDLLSAGGRIYHETHFAPLLQMQKAAKEIAFEIECADGSMLPVLVSSTVVEGSPERSEAVRTAVFDASDRRRYEEELLHARKREHEIAQRLQSSMLAGALPEAPGLEVAASYRPAVSGLDVGGDWYDAFWVAERRIGFVVGDVVGRGIEAAAAMGQLRSATRALASTGLRPAPLLEALDAYASRHDVGGLATVVYAEVDLGTRELRFSCAGHLPPVLAPGGEDPHLAWEGRSLPLDAFGAGDRSREEAACTLPSESLVLLYTDGLVERRTQTIDERMALLVEEVRVHRDEPPSTLTTSLLEALDAGDHSDDVCLLAARV